MAFNYYPQYFQPQQIPMQMAQNQTQQSQASGFVSVRSEEEARNYPVAYGNSVTFKDENSPYIYTKTMGFSQLDRPIFDKYKLVKEEAEIQIQTPKTDPKWGDLEAEIGRLWQAIDDLKKREDDDCV